MRHTHDPEINVFTILTLSNESLFKFVLPRLSELVYLSMLLIFWINQEKNNIDKVGNLAQMALVD